MASANAIRDNQGLTWVGSAVRHASLRSIDSAPPQSEAASSCVQASQESLRAASMSARLQADRWPSAVPTPDVIVSLARNFVIAHIGRKVGAADLAGASGVSESTLRRAVYGETGLRLAAFVVHLKLDQARDWLSSNRESRSVTQLCRALGCATPAPFCRAYARKFGETMSATRQRAVQLGEKVMPLVNKAPDRP